MAKRQRPGEAVDLVDDNHVDLAGANVVQEPVPRAGLPWCPLTEPAHHGLPVARHAHSESAFPPKAAQ